jgi:protein-S-isoprenylcysteine O-methyltransferase Ste14
MKKYIPLIMPLVLIISVPVVYVVRRPVQGIAPLRYLEPAFILLYAAWIAFETRIARQDIAEEMRLSDYGTREIYAVCQALTVLSAIWFATDAYAYPAMKYAGLALFAGGTAFRLWAIAALGRFYSHAVRRTDGHRIISSGPYRFIRHPAYAGMALAHAGVIVFFFSIPALFVFLLMLIPSIIIRILVEEKTLFAIDGYESYARNRKRLLPMVW